MTSGLFKKSPSQVTTTENDVVPDQAEIDREIEQLKEDSAKDVQRQLEQQRLAEKEDRVKEEVKKVAEEVEGRFAPAVRKAKEHEAKLMSIK